jgi:hypothetical protein
VEDVSRWFFSWLEYHQFLHPGRWVKPNEAHALDFYEGWIGSLRRAGATKEQARESSRLLQAKKPGYPSTHLASLLDILREIRGGSAEGPSPAEVGPPPVPGGLYAECRDCPECEGRGWARRRLKVHNLPRPFVVDLFCRCSAGRWRKENDVELTRGLRLRLHDDLQSIPGLWDARLKPHRTWKNRPCLHDMELEPGTEENLHYLPPGEPAPAPARPRDVAAMLANPAPKPEPQEAR